MSLFYGREMDIGFDFMKSRPALPTATSQAPNIILVRAVLHNWSDKYAMVLLRNLRSLATSETKLLVIDSIMEYACPGTVEHHDDTHDSELLNVRGSKCNNPPPSPPLLTNLGQAGLFAYELDITVESFLFL